MQEPFCTSTSFTRLALRLLLIIATVVPSLPAQPLGGAAEAEYQVGERGPAGGVVFLVSADEAGRRRYVEAAPEDIKGFVDPDTAAELAQEYRGAGFSDWRLPTYRELNEMYTHRDLIGGLSADWYWSSSREPAYGVRYQHLGHGSQGYSRYELFNYRVRLVREFSSSTADP